MAEEKEVRLQKTYAMLSIKMHLEPENASVGLSDFAREIFR